MKNMNFAKGDLITNKMDVNLNVLCSSMLNWIRGHVDCGHIVTIDKCGRMERAMKLLKKLTEPTTLRNSMSHNAVLGFSTGSRDHSLALGRPRNQIVSIVDAIA
jgi:nucleoside-triphosphatase THEP1